MDCLYWGYELHFLFLFSRCIIFYVCLFVCLSVCLVAAYVANEDLYIIDNILKLMILEDNREDY